LCNDPFEELDNVGTDVPVCPTETIVETTDTVGADSISAQNSPNETDIKHLVYDKNKIRNMLLKITPIDENLFIGYKNPYTNHPMHTINDIRDYMYELYPDLRYNLGNGKNKKNRKKLNKLKHQNHIIKLPLEIA
jgi:hypothetical protein